MRQEKGWDFDVPDLYDSMPLVVLTLSSALPGVQNLDFLHDGRVYILFLKPWARISRIDKVADTGATVYFPIKGIPRES